MKLNMEQIEKGKDLIFSVEVFVTPDVELGQYKNLGIEKKVDAVVTTGAGNDIGLPSSEFSAINTMIPLNFIFLVIPIVGFFFCVLDRKSNMKNIVSILCCLLGVVSILTIVTINLISLGSMLALLLYILTSFLTVFSIFARFSAPSDAEKAADIRKK